MSKTVLPLFSSKSFIVFGLTFRSLINFKFIFVYDVRECSNFILLHLAVQFSQHHFLKRLSFLHCVFLLPLSLVAAKSLQSCPTVRPHRQQPIRLLCPWDSPGKNTGVGCHFLLQCMKVKSESEFSQSCPTLSDPMDCGLPGSSVHGFSRREYWNGVPLPSPCHWLGNHKCVCLSLSFLSCSIGLYFYFWASTIWVLLYLCRIL